MSNKHSPFYENLSAYALGALDPAEAAALESHLQTCADCRAELAAYQRISEGLLAALPPQTPPPALRGKLAARLPGTQKIRRPHQSWSFGQWVAVGAFALLLGLNIFAFLQIKTLQKQQASLATYLHNDQAAITMLAYPSTQSLPVSGEGVAGSMLVDRQREVGVLFVWNLPRLETGQTYQVWLIDAQDQRISGGVFLPEADQPYTSVVIASPKPLGEFSGLGVTVEPLGGSPAPTGPRILKVDF